MGFEEQLAVGQTYELNVKDFLIWSKRSFITLYDKETQPGKGPRVYCNGCETVAPDFIVGDSFVDVKSKNKFMWYNKKYSSDYHISTGIDYNSFRQYRECGKTFHKKVYIFFVHTCTDTGEEAKKTGCPKEFPTGLYVAEIPTLKEGHNGYSFHADKEEHYWDNYGKKDVGMWMWDITELQRIEEWDNFVLDQK